MRRPRGEASHEPPHIEDLLDQASQHLEVLGDLTVRGLALASSEQISAFHRLSGYLLEASTERNGVVCWDHQSDHALDEGSIGPAFDLIVKESSG